MHRGDQEPLALSGNFYIPVTMENADCQKQTENLHRLNVKSACYVTQKNITYLRDIMVTYLHPTKMYYL